MKNFTHPLKYILGFCLSVSLHQAGAQAVTEVITDYNGYWKSSIGSVSNVKPDNAHNLLAFSYNGVRYSTGANDGVLTANGQAFTPAQFAAAPFVNITGIINNNTKVGFGAMLDGVANGPSVVPPAWGIGTYLTDGIKGLGLGTCVANLPSGQINFTVQNLRAAAIGDGIPDVLVTQVADPTGSSDRYTFTNAAGVPVGNFRDVSFNSIGVVGNWTADFYEANANPLILIPGFTRTDRPLRIWAADFSDFGITAANYTQITTMRVDLSGNSDIAFVSYNERSAGLQQISLPTRLHFFHATLNNNQVVAKWQTSEEENTDRFEVERSSNLTDFTSVALVMAKNTAGVHDYTFTDNRPLPASSYYRLKQIDKDGKIAYSPVVRINRNKEANALIQVYPNPASTGVAVLHPATSGQSSVMVYNTAGAMVLRKNVLMNTTYTTLELSGVAAGSYVVYWQSGEERRSNQLVIQ